MFLLKKLKYSNLTRIVRNLWKYWNNSVLKPRFSRFHQRIMKIGLNMYILRVLNFFHTNYFWPSIWKVLISIHTSPHSKLLSSFHCYLIFTHPLNFGQDNYLSKNEKGFDICKKVFIFISKGLFIYRNQLKTRLYKSIDNIFRPGCVQYLQLSNSLLEMKLKSWSLFLFHFVIFHSIFLIDLVS